MTVDGSQHVTESAAEADLKSAWLTRGGKGCDLVARAIEESAVLSRWQVLTGDLTGADRTEITRRLQEVAPADKMRERAHAMGELNILVNEMSSGDVAVMPLEDRRHVAIGVISGEYLYRGESSTGDGHGVEWHMRPAIWLATDIRRDSFPSDLARGLNINTGVCRFTAEGAAERLISLAHDRL